MEIYVSKVFSQLKSQLNNTPIINRMEDQRCKRPHADNQITRRAFDEEDQRSRASLTHINTTSNSVYIVCIVCATENQYFKK